MENRESQILSEIKDMMASIRSQLEILDAKMAELQQAVDDDGADMVPIDLELDDDLPFADVPVAVELESEPETELTAEPVQEADPQPAPEPDPEPEPEPEVPDDDDLPIFAEPEPVCQPVPVVAEEPEKKQAVIDSMTDRQAWRSDMPGTQVRDIRSAISLNDRIFFINYLFNEDPMAFQDALTRINQMGSLDEVVAYVLENHSEWDLESDVVYRFMMAVRRKVR